MTWIIIAWVWANDALPETWVASSSDLSGGIVWSEEVEPWRRGDVFFARVQVLDGVETDVKVEAMLDDGSSVYVLERRYWQSACAAADIDGDGTVVTPDLGLLRGAMGACSYGGG